MECDQPTVSKCLIPIFSAVATASSEYPPLCDKPSPISGISTPFLSDTTEDSAKLVIMENVEWNHQWCTSMISVVGQHWIDIKHTVSISQH
eukprot:m.322142 g.322142  ORF g.322142 m.322142 type:complete len:91 (-) comp20346_c0_seq12:175-447(-)